MRPACDTWTLQAWVPPRKSRAGLPRICLHEGSPGDKQVVREETRSWVVQPKDWARAMGLGGKAWPDQAWITPSARSLHLPLDVSRGQGRGGGTQQVPPGSGSHVCVCATSSQGLQKS